MTRLMESKMEKKWTSAALSCQYVSESIWGTGKKANRRGCAQLCYSYGAIQCIFWHCSKSHTLLSSVNVGDAEVVSRGSETLETPSSVITLTTAMSVAVNSEMLQQRCWHSLTRVGRNLFFGEKRKPTKLYH